MNTKKIYEVVIVGGSYAGLSAALALGRALRNVLVIDSGNPCNSVATHSHNFLTRDGESPANISQTAREQLRQYNTIEFFVAKVSGIQSHSGIYQVSTTGGDSFNCRKLIFATGIIDLLPDIRGFKDCWGKSVLHCPYCHGYEARWKTTAVLATTDQSFEYVILLSNWSKDLHVLTNGESPFTETQRNILSKHTIQLHHQSINALNHIGGQIQTIEFADQNSLRVDVLYSRLPFIQQNTLPQELGCAIDQQGYLVTDGSGKTNIPGIYVCGDNSNKLRTISNAVAMGTNAGMALNKELTLESY